MTFTRRNLLKALFWPATTPISASVAQANQARSILSSSPELGLVYNDGTFEAAKKNSAALVRAFAAGASQNRKIYIPAGKIYLLPTVIGPLTRDICIECDATFINQSGTAAAHSLLVLQGNGKAKIFWKGGRFDANGGPHSCLEVLNWREADVDVHEAYGIVCTQASSGGTSGLWFANVASGRAAWSFMHDLHQGSSTQGSLPRCFSVGTDNAVRSNCSVFLGRCHNVHGVVVVGDMAGGTVTTHGGKITNATDNGIYNVGNAALVSCYDIRIDSVDEPAVNSGSGALVLHNPEVRNSRNAFGLQNCGGLTIVGGYLHFIPGVTPFRTRPKNIASLSLDIRDSRIECTPKARVIGLGDFGAVENFKDSQNVWMVHYDQSVAVTDDITIFNMRAGKTCQIYSDSSWIISKSQSSAEKNIVIYLNMPVVTSPSRWIKRFRSGGNTTIKFSYSDQALLRLG
jgi:hypothetical protein